MMSNVCHIQYFSLLIKLEVNPALDRCEALAHTFHSIRHICPEVLDSPAKETNYFIDWKIDVPCL